MASNKDGEQENHSKEFGLGEYLIIIWLVIVALCFFIVFGRSTVSIHLTQNIDVIFTKWYSGIVFFILPPVALLLRSSSKFILPGVIFYLWALCIIVILAFLTSPTRVHNSDSRITLELYYSAHFWRFDILADILKIAVISISTAATIYLLKSKRYK